MKTPIQGGFLVAVEGIDGAGKSTVAATLAQWCGERGLLCGLSKEPTSLQWGQKLRASASAGRLTLEEELNLFYQDRQEHFENSVQPGLSENAVMILDRYYWSTAAYQGIRGVDIEAVRQYNETRFPIPDLILLLDLPAEVGQQRILARGDVPNEFENVEAQRKIREIFLQLPATYQGYCASLDANRPWREVNKQCLEIFKTLVWQKLKKTGDASAVGAQYFEIP